MGGYIFEMLYIIYHYSYLDREEFLNLHNGIWNFKTLPMPKGPNSQIDKIVFLLIASSYFIYITT